MLIKEKILLFTLFLISFLPLGFSQTNCDCDAFIDFNFKGQVYIYNNPSGQIIDSINHDFVKEDWLVVNIQKNKRNFLYVDIKRSLTDLNKIGWIKKSKFIVINASNFNKNNPLILYSKPNINSKPLIAINEWTYLLLVIENCKDDWLNVNLENKGNEYKGWLPKNKQCPNPYTTCN